MEQEFFKETDLTLLKRNITPNSNRDDFYKQGPVHQDPA